MLDATLPPNEINISFDFSRVKFSNVPVITNDNPLKGNFFLALLILQRIPCEIRFSIISKLFS